MRTCKRKTNLMDIYSLSKKVIMGEGPKEDIKRQLCFMLDKVFFYAHTELEVGSYNMNSKKSVLDEYKVNADKNKQTLTLKLNREGTERVIKIYIQLDQPSFKFNIYKPSLSKSKPIEYGQWSLRVKEED